jgi:hypothetical protein
MTVRGPPAGCGGDLCGTGPACGVENFTITNH